MAKAKKVLIKAVRSLRELWNLAQTDERYKRLLFVAASNLGGPDSETAKDLRLSYDWLVTNAMETDEAGTVAEVNFVRDVRLLEAGHRGPTWMK